MQLSISSVIRSPDPVDRLVIGFSTLVSILAILVLPGEASWRLLVPLNVGLGVVIAILSLAATRPEMRLLRFLHDWYPVGVIFLLFKEVYIIIQSIGRPDIDLSLIGIDHFLFGVHPTVWLTQFSSPLLTEILQLAYVSYYLLMVTLAAELQMRRDYDRFSFVMFTLTYGFFLSYVGYILFPAIGPRFTLHAFGSLEKELPGIFFTNPLRDFLDAGESIPHNLPNPAAVAQRDAFPSGHTEMTLLVMYFAGKYRLRSRYILYVVGSLLIISTVYLRYHYVVDLLGGALFMGFTVWTAPALFSLLQRNRAGANEGVLGTQGEAPPLPSDS